MDRRKRLATAGAISLTASAAIVALASGVGLFGLTNDSPRVGKLSPIDSTHSTSTTASTVPDTGATTPADDPASHDANDDRVTSSPTANIVPEANDDTRGPGSSSSGRDHDDD